MSPKVLVVVRTKNRPVLLARALRSIEAQTFADHAVVIVNDGGDPAEVDRLAGDHKVLHHDTSKGRSEALNAGIEAITSDYVAIHDDDDSWAPGFLAATVAHLDAHPEDGGVATCSAVVVEELDGSTVTEVRREVVAPHLRQASLLQVCVKNYIPPIAFVVRRSAFDAVGPFDPTLPVLEDWDFLLRLLSRYPMGFLPDEPLAFWHHRETATDDTGNSVFAEASEHERVEVLIRDRYLRQDLSGEGTGLGLQLASAYQRSRLAAEWGEAHRDHLVAVATRNSLEVGRLRGEMLALRETLERVATKVGAPEKRTGKKK